MKLRDGQVTLQLLDWSASAGGEHFHADLVGYLDGKYTKVELYQKLSQKTAAQLNKKDRVRTYKPGDLSRRVDTRKSAIALGKKEWLKHFPDGTILFVGSGASADPQEVIAVSKRCPKQVMTLINEMYKTAEKIDWYERDEKTMNKISDLFMNLMKTEVP